MLLCADRAIAAPFVNLDFEQATVPPGTPPGFIPATVGFPGWTPRIGEIPQNVVAYNNTGIGEAEVVLYDQFQNQGAFFVLEGTYSAALITDFAFGSRASLSQTGDVPSGTRSLRFLVNYRAQVMAQIPVVLVNGIEAPVIQLSPPNGFDPILFGADLTNHAGTTVDLRFSSGAFDQDRLVAVDAVTFSVIPIPEPSAAAVITSFTVIMSLRDLQARRPRHELHRLQRRQRRRHVYDRAQWRLTGSHWRREVQR